MLFFSVLSNILSRIHTKVAGKKMDRKLQFTQAIGFLNTSGIPKRLLIFLCSFLLSVFSLQAQVSVSATAGTLGPTNYATLSAAFAAINAGTHQGVINISITANTTEPGAPTALLKSATPSSYTSITIKPSGGNWTIGGTATLNRAIVELSGADNVTIDGDDPTTAGPGERECPPEEAGG